MSHHSATALPSATSRTDAVVANTRPESSSLVRQDEGGRTVIQPHVVAKIAGLAIREVEGVHSLVPVGAGQAIGNLARSVAGGEFRDLGVSVEVGQVEATVDARIVTDYGGSIPDIATAIRTNVQRRIVEMTGLRVKEINLEVVDLWFDEPTSTDSTHRVQ